MSAKFTCEECHETYDKAWTDEEASAEAELAFGITTGATVCDDCYNKIMYSLASNYANRQTHQRPSHRPHPSI